jgi:hypothetical protein
MEGSVGHTVSGGEAVRQGGRGKPQPWRAYTAMENHSYEGSIDQLWNSIAVEGISGGSAPGRAR